MSHFKKDKVTGVSVNLHKAFDRVCHNKLLSKLALLGIKGNEYKWFEPYEKKQFVGIK